MIAVSRRCAKLRPWQVFSRADPFSLVNAGAAFRSPWGRAAGSSGSGSCSSSASQRKNCRSARNWLLAAASLSRVGGYHPSLHVIASDLLPPVQLVRGVRWAAAQHAIIFAVRFDGTFP